MNYCTFIWLSPGASRDAQGAGLRAGLAIFESRGVQGCPGRGTARRQSQDSKIAWPACSPAPWASLDAPGLAVPRPGHPWTPRDSTKPSSHRNLGSIALFCIICSTLTLNDLALCWWIHLCRCFDKNRMIRSWIWRNGANRVAAAFLSEYWTGFALCTYIFLVWLRGWHSGY
jgi:hypothetical protein